MKTPAPSAPPTFTPGHRPTGTSTFLEPATGARVDQGSSSAYDRALYQPAGRARRVPNLDAIGDEDLAFYAAEGYLAVDQAFSPAEVQSALEGLTDLVMGRNPDFKEVYFEAKAAEILPRLTPEERLDYVRKLDHFVEFDARLKAMALHAKLLRVIHRMLGTPEAVLSSDMALLKPPRLGREKPWHQDMAYYRFRPGTQVIGVWVALDEATVENGCMQLLPELRRQGAILHFKRRDWQICDAEILGRRSVAAPLPPGGLLFFDGLLPHGTPENRTDTRRRAVQFHYHSPGAQMITDEERLGIFGSEGKGATC